MKDSPSLKHIAGDDPQNPDRRQFTVGAILTLLTGITITMSACGDDDGPIAPSPTPGGSGITGSVSANHGHSVVVTGAQLSAGNVVTLDIRGTANHPHTVELTTGEVQQIAAGQRVAKESSTDDGHRHTVTFN
jgi:hypothetical protein